MQIVYANLMSSLWIAGCRKSGNSIDCVVYLALKLSVIISDPKFRCHPIVFNCGCQVGYIRKSLLYHLVVDKFTSCKFFVIPQVKCSIPVTRFDKKRKGLTIQIANANFMSSLWNTGRLKSGNSIDH